MKGSRASVGTVKYFKANFGLGLGRAWPSKANISPIAGLKVRRSCSAVCRSSLSSEGNVWRVEFFD
jgi:hypothetical protein